jgi:tetratricopeptide (TPR) repeat protein
MKELNKDNQIDRYVTGKLEDAELWEFQHEMENDPKLAEEVKLRAEIYRALTDTQKIKLRENLKALRKENKSGLRFLQSWKVRAIAASIAVLLLVGAGFTTSIFRTTDNQDLYAAYFNPESSLLSVRSGSASDNTSLNLGMLSYDQGQYDESIEIFKSIPDNIVARLYCGLAYMNVKNYKAAIDEFNHVLSHGDNLFTDQAEWNIGLSYLADNKIDEAKKTFASIAGEKGAYQQRASDLLKELKNRH